MAGHRPASSKPDPTTVANVEDPSIAAPLPEDEVLTSYDDQTGDWTAPSGGSSGVIVAGRAQYSSAQVVPSGAYTNFAWAHTQNDVLLDLTNPQEPLALADGIYTVGVRVTADAVHAGKSAYLQLDLDSDGDDCYATGDLSMDAVIFDSPVTTVTCCYFVPQGGKLVAAIQHDVGADTTFNVCMNVSFVPAAVGLFTS